jgi:hypothetical protein
MNLDEANAVHSMQAELARHDGVAFTKDELFTMACDLEYWNFPTARATRRVFERIALPYLLEVGALDIRRFDFLAKSTPVSPINIEPTCTSRLF